MLTLKSRSGCGRVNYSLHLGFDQSTVWGLENVNGIWDFTADGEVGFAKIGYGCGIIGKKTIFGIAMTEVWDAGCS